MTSSYLLTGPNFKQERAEDIQLVVPGQAQSSAQKLGALLSGGVPSTVPAVGIVAKASGTQATATLLTGYINSVDTVATAGDAVALPLAQAGLEVCAINTTATSMQVFGSGTDTINAVATATGVAQAAGITAWYVCTKSAPAGKWFRLLSA